MRVAPKEHYPWYLSWIFRRQESKFGQELIPPKIWGRSPKLFFGFNLFFKALDRNTSPISKEMRALVNVLVSQINHCPFCIDLNTARLIEAGGSIKKVESLHDYAYSSLFTEKERDSLAYAEAMTRTDKEVTDQLFKRLKKHYDEDEIVELTALIAFQNCSSKFNAALDLPNQGICKI